MKKNIIACLLALTVILSNVCNALALTLVYDGQEHEYTGTLYTLYVNGEIIETPLEPIIFNNRAVVPVREVFEALGATVEYEADTKKVTVKTETDTVVMTINENIALVNGKPVSIPDGVTPKLIGKKGEWGKTMVPVRFVSEELGLIVEFSAEEKAIFVSQPPTATPTPVVTLNSLNVKEKEDSIVITINADGVLTELSEPILTASNVLYTDVLGVDYALKNTYNIDIGGVKNVRFGRHADYTRIALDLDGKAAYDVKLSATKKGVVISVSAEQPEDPNATPDPKPTANPTPNPDNAEQKIVVLDAGHGGTDPGALGYLDNEEYKEKDLTLSIAKKVEAILTREGIPVLMTRSGDIYPTLDERPMLANQENAALFVSIHINSADDVPGANGAEVYYCSTNNDDDYGITSKELATNLLNSVMELTGQKNRGVKSESHAVTRKANMPAALYEVGFISNQQELENMISDSFQDKVAAGLAEGIIKTWKQVTIPDPEKAEETEETEETETEETTEVTDEQA